jgi:acid phosphatase
MYFLSFGDWGDNTIIKKKVYDLIIEKSPNAIISLGDNFYDFGVQSEHDSLLKLQYEHYFPKIPFYAILGNHDYLGNTQAQIRYSSMNPSWIMPYRYYDQGYPDVHLIAIDTFDLAMNESFKNSICMGMNIFHYNSIQHSLHQDHQLKWLEYVLMSSRSKWKIVFGHYPIFSNGVHGNTDELINTILPLLKKYKVNLYLCGHDHNISHCEHDGLHCLVSGTGSRSTPITNTNGFTPLSSTTGVAYIRTSMKTLEFGFYNLKGETIFKKVISTS